ncbi:hypothetical protein LOK49_LG02G01344 [Camellia lanceoleosa]|uniref:Uncharacterized protein n=1 Tax=Camellia lanceoleosa TaxID=1840588 RepID=A0ACC0ITE9_9ERIC|nr:hypothetical protein LOK49_LG02G01344 [Camellia lanceoleosa]
MVTSAFKSTMKRTPIVVSSRSIVRRSGGDNTNRSRFLDIDSDDDEWHEPLVVEDSAIESLGDDEDEDGYEEYSEKCNSDDCEGRVMSDHKERLPNNDDDGLSDRLNPDFLMEPCDAKLWEARYPMSPFEDFDFVSTRNVIEEIFGPNTETLKPAS